MKKKKYKLLLLIIVFLLAFIEFLIVYLRPYDYEREYTVDEYKIVEKYEVSSTGYTFLVTYEGVTYPFQMPNKYLRTKELINGVNVYTDDSETCIMPLSGYFNFYPVCHNKDELYSYSLSKMNIETFIYSKIEQIKKKKDNLSISYLNNKDYLVSNYKGFISVSNGNIDKIKLFTKDIYRLDLYYQFKDILILPDYDELYYFSKLYFINIKDGKVKEVSLDNQIAFDSIFLGEMNNYVYLFDKKEEKEYRINVYKRKVEESEIKNIKDGKLVNSNTKELLLLDGVTKDILGYKVVDKKLYQEVGKSLIKVSNKDINELISVIDGVAYYITGDSLYMYSNKTGEVLLMKNNEWNFNYKNVVFIY